MENNFTPEQIEKAKAAKSPEELLSLARENVIDLTEEQAKTYFEKLSNSGELSDDELGNVAGGGCLGPKAPNAVEYFSGNCDNWRCKKCGKDVKTTGKEHQHGAEITFFICGHCKYGYHDAAADCYCCSHPSKKK